MNRRQVNDLSVKAVMVLSALALATVLTGFFQAPQPDEGAAAHIFQLCIVTLLPLLLLFLITGNWQEPVRCLRRLAFPGATLVCAFAALFYLEHYYYVQHYR